jgi:hypothetical protein
MTPAQLSFDALSDDQLLDEARRLAERERAATADLLRCLMEVDARRLYLREGCASLFTYCTQVLHLAEGAAYNRIEAARAARRFPPVLEAIADGSITVTSARMIAPQLTLENHQVLLEAVRHKSKREIEVLLANVSPRPAVPTVLRKLPVSALVPASAACDGRAVDAAMVRSEGPTRLSSAAGGTEAAGHERNDQSGPECVPVASRAKARDAAVPLSTDDYRLQVTIRAETHEKLRRVQDLLRHAIPHGDIAEVLDRALTLLLADVERRRCAAANRPRADNGSRTGTRHIPAAVKREVWRRDQGRCAFTSGTRRCAETAFVEFHHVVPYADGGAATVGNIELRCRAHNQYEAALWSGDVC